MTLLICSCQESTQLVFYDKNAPAPVPIDLATVSVENLPGKSVLKYTVPDDENLLYVKAVFETSPGIERQTQSSKFVDTLAVEGFADAGEYPIKLYSVGKNEKVSDAVEIMVSPLIPPLAEAFSSLNLIAVFGGVAGTFSNPQKAAIKAVLMADTANIGEPYFLQSFIINNSKAEFNVRGLESKTSKYFVYLMDRWGNKTETKEYELTPLYEERLDKTLWKEHKLDSDFRNVYNNDRGFAFTNLFSDYISPWNNLAGAFLPEAALFPRYFTIDLGVIAKLSRLNLVPWWWMIYETTPRNFEIYGTLSLNPGDDLTGDEWQLIGQFETYKPSGNDPRTITQEDIDFAWPGGFNIDIKPSDIQPDPYFSVRIIRFKIISNWRNTDGTTEDDDGFSIDELTFWGTIEK